MKLKKKLRYKLRKMFFDIPLLFLRTRRSKTATENTKFSISTRCPSLAKNQDGLNAETATIKMWWNEKITLNDKKRDWMIYIQVIIIYFGLKLAGNKRAGFSASLAYLPRHYLIWCVSEQVKLATLCLKKSGKFFCNIDFRVKRPS